MIRVGATVEEQLQNDLVLETKGVNTYNEAVRICAEEVDNVSRELLPASCRIRRTRRLGWNHNST